MIGVYENDRIIDMQLGNWGYLGNKIGRVRMNLLHERGGSRVSAHKFHLGLVQKALRANLRK